MGAHLNQLTLAHDQNQIRPPDLRQAVGDDEGSTPLGGCVNCPLNQIFGCAVNRAGRIIQNQNCGSVRKARASARR